MKTNSKKNKINYVELVLIYLLSPCCIPIITLITFAFGASWDRHHTSGLTLTALLLSIISVTGYLLAYKRHRNIYPLLIAAISGLGIFYHYIQGGSKNTILFQYLGMVGFLIAMILNFYRSKLHGIKSIKNV